VHERTRKNVEELVAENDRLRGELAMVSARLARNTEEYLLVEEQNANLAHLYVASFRLHGTLKKGEVLEAIQEIVTNLIGSEEHAVFGVGEDGLTLLSSFGLEGCDLASIPLDRGILGQVARTGERYLAQGQTSSEAAPYEEHLTAGIPLMLGGDVVGVLAIFRLLPQKPELEAGDHELFDLLATHAATALAFTELYANAQREGSRA
jgi:GAF domain-containing protein